MKSNLKTTHTNQKGVALAGAAIAMTIALGLVVGLVVSVISTQSDISDTDTSQRVLAAAEGGAESFLSMNRRQLEDWVDDDNDDNGDRTAICNDLGGTLNDGKDGCVFTFHPTSSDDVEAQATVMLDSYNANHGRRGSEEIVQFSLDVGQVREISLEGYSGSFAICWDDQNENVGLYLIGYNPTSGKFNKAMVTCYDDNGDGECPDWDITSNPGGGTGLRDDTEPPKDDELELGLSSCNYKLGNLLNPLGGGPTPDNRLRIYVVPGTAGTSGPVTVAAIPKGGEKFPEQGFKITSVGTLTSPSPIQIEKVVTVYRSHPFLPSLFDFALYAEGDANVNLRN